MTAVRRPVLRYHGGKWRLAPWIIRNFPPHKTYVEPFGGAASVLLRKPRVYAEVYNDLDGDVVNLFRVLRDAEMAADLVRLIELSPFSRAEFEAAYGVSDDPVEQARRMIVRSFMGYGAFGTVGQPTGFRTGLRKTRVSAAADWRNYPAALRTAVERLQGVTIENVPALRALELYDREDTLFYVDPPYLHGTRGAAGWYNHEMTDDEHRDLAAALREVRGDVVISGYPCDLYDVELYSDWQRVERVALADAARKRTEVLWIKPGSSRQRRLLD